MVDCKNAFINSINPKFKNWNRPFTFALIVLFLTVCPTINIAMALIHDCPKNSKTAKLTELARSYADGSIDGCIHDFTILTLQDQPARVVSLNCRPTSLMDSDAEDYPEFLKEEGKFDFSALDCDNYCNPKYRDQCKNNYSENGNEHYPDCGMDYGQVGNLNYKDCPSYVSVIGIAFGWASMIEVGVTLLVMGIGVLTGCLEITSSESKGVIAEMVETAKTMA